MDYSWSPSRGTWVVILLVMVTLGHFGVTRQGSMGQLYQVGLLSFHNIQRQTSGSILDS